MPSLPIEPTRVSLTSQVPPVMALPFAVALNWMFWAVPSRLMVVPPVALEITPPAQFPMPPPTPVVVKLTPPPGPAPLPLLSPPVPLPLPEPPVNVFFAPLALQAAPIPASVKTTGNQRMLILRARVGSSSLGNARAAPSAVECIAPSLAIGNEKRGQ
jgi:hypothetical protein